MSVVVAEGVVEVTADGRDIPRQIARDINGNTAPVNDSGQVLGTNLGVGVGRGLLGLGKVTAVALGAVALAVGVGVGAVVVEGVKFEASMQNYVAAFTPLLGSADAAKDKLGELSAFAAATPFTISGLAGASQTLLAFGEANANLLPDLKMLGDISQGNQEKLDGLSLAYGQVQSTGRLMGQDLLQMINQGFNPLVEISKITGESMVDLKARMEAGGVSFDEVRAAMQHATSEGGMFFGAMELGAKTLTGAWSSTQDGARILSGAIVSDLTPALSGVLNLGVNPLLGGLVGLITGVDGASTTVANAAGVLNTQVEGLSSTITGIAGNIGTIVTAVGPAVSSLIGTLISSLAIMLPSILGLAGQIITGLVTALVDNAADLVTAAVPIILNFATGLIGQLPMLIGVGVEVLLALVNGIVDSLPTLIPAVVTAIIDSLTMLLSADTLTSLLDAGLALIMGLATGLIAALPSLIEALPGIIVGIITFLVESIPTLIDAGLELFLALVGALPDIIIGIVDAIPQIIKGVLFAIIGAIPKLIEAGVKLFIALIENLPTIIIEIVKAVPEIIGGLVGAFTDPATIAEMGRAGGELIRGLWNGISDLGGWLWSKVSGFFGNLVGGIKSFFGIHSPSTLMYDEIGTPLGQGVGGGFIDSLLGSRSGIMGAMDSVANMARSGIGALGNLVVTGTYDPSGIAGSSIAAQSGQLAQSGGGISIGSITLDASKFKTLQDLIDMIEAINQAARQGRGANLGATP